MAKVDQQAYGIIHQLLDKGYTLRIEKHKNSYEVTVWEQYNKNMEHFHYEGEGLLEALLKINAGKSN